MPRENQPTITTSDTEKTALIVHQIQQVNVDRTPKDIKTLRSANQNAESIHNPNRSRLYDLYADVDWDGHLTGVIGKRIAGVSNKVFRFVGQDDQEVDGMEGFLESNEFTDIVKGIMKSIFWGITGFEFIPGDKLQFKEIPRKHIKPEKKIITIYQSDQEGISYEDLDNIFVVGSEKDLGLYLKCSFYALIKKGAFADWAQYVEIFGQPVRIVKYDAYDDKTKIELREVLDQSGSSLALMIPKQADFEMMDGKQSNGDGQLQERLKNACNNEMSIIILGNTETTSNDNGGSNAKAKEQGEQQLEVTKDDLKMVKNLLNSEKFLRILKSYGLPVDGGSFKFEKEIDLAKLSVRKDIDLAVAKQVPVEDDYFYETYNIPKPKNYAQLKAKMEEAAAADRQSGFASNKPSGNGIKNDKVGNKKPPKDKLSAFERLRTTLADFFDLAPRS